MITYFDIVDTLTEIVNNEKINKKGLSLVYELEENNHIKLNEDLYYRLNPKGVDFKPTDTFEVELSGIMAKCIKKIKNG